ncbi:glutathione S-transferase [uncultured Litoreibacter sp.]|uniref:glutathione S-transferase n=1 Tax=uncultured Litoreibacter sp. TaxID=1392394 RepID=UPI002614C320|nr:glutathione S-transferase [uncultured Litoreibacter sp.]
MRPILYSFRRCPYAMRARLALVSAGIETELREILLRDKAPEFLEASPKGTVPVIVAKDTVIEESLDIMDWALAQNDPEGWLNFPPEGRALIAECDGPFKTALDRYKYQNRHQSDAELERQNASVFLRKLDAQLGKKPYLYGDHPTLPDMATVTFVRQFANTDRAWFDAQNWYNLRHWLDAFTESDRFAHIMGKYPKWQAGDPVTVFA